MTVVESTSLMNHLLLASAAHREAGVELQQALIAMEQKLKVQAEAAWAPVEGEVVEVKSQIEEVPKLPREKKPEIGGWKGGNGFLGL